MAQITIVTTAEEKSTVLNALKKLVDKTVAVSEIAKTANMNQNRVRYVITDLVESGVVRRIPTRIFNKHYVRYKYEIVQEELHAN